MAKQPKQPKQPKLPKLKALKPLKVVGGYTKKNGTFVSPYLKGGFKSS